MKLNCLSQSFLGSISFGPLVGDVVVLLSKEASLVCASRSSNEIYNYFVKFYKRLTGRYLDAQNLSNSLVERPLNARSVFTDRLHQD